MKILLLTQFFSHTRGGGEYVFNMIAQELAVHGHEVWVVTNKIKDERYEEHKNIKIVFVPPVLEYGGGMPPGIFENVRYVANAVGKGREIIKRERIDVIHSNNFAPSLAGSILSSVMGTPHVTTVHDVFSLCGKNYWKQWGSQTGVSRVSVMLAPVFERWMLKKFRYKCVHTVSEASRDDLVKFGVKRPVYVIYNAIKEEEDSFAAVDRFQFVYVGRLVFYKNLEVVIKAVKMASRTEPRVRLVVVGDGPYKESLQRLVSRLGVEANVVFAGYVKHDKKMKVIAQSNALVFPSLCEGFGLVMLEAFSQKRPVLVSKIRPMSDVIKDGRTGFVVDAQDERQWAERMLFCMNNLEEIDGMGTEGNRLLHESFSSTRMFEGVVKMYDEQI